MPDTPTDNPTPADPSSSGAAARTPKPAAAKPAVAAAVPDAPAGEENPLHKKLRLRSGDTGLVIAAPQDDDNPLLPLPQGFSALATLGELGSQEGQFDYLHIFARDKAELAESFGTLRDKLRPGGSLWISWMKSTSKHGGGQATELNDNVIRRLALTHGLVDLKVAALDRDWSALLLVHRKR